MFFINPLAFQPNSYYLNLMTKNIKLLFAFAVGLVAHLGSPPNLIRGNDSRFATGQRWLGEACVQCCCGIVCTASNELDKNLPQNGRMDQISTVLDRFHIIEVTQGLTFQIRYRGFDCLPRRILYQKSKLMSRVWQQYQYWIFKNLDLNTLRSVTMSFDKDYIFTLGGEHKKNLHLLWKIVKDCDKLTTFKDVEEVLQDFVPKFSRIGVSIMPNFIYDANSGKSKFTDQEEHDIYKGWMKTIREMIDSHLIDEQISQWYETKIAQYEKALLWFSNEALPTFMNSSSMIYKPVQITSSGLQVESEESWYSGGKKKALALKTELVCKIIDAIIDGIDNLPISDKLILQKINGEYRVLITISGF